MRNLSLILLVFSSFAFAEEIYCNFKMSSSSEVTTYSMCPDFLIVNSKVKKNLSRCPAIEKTYNVELPRTPSKNDCIVGKKHKDNWIIFRKYLSKRDLKKLVRK